MPRGNGGRAPSLMPSLSRDRVVLTLPADPRMVRLAGVVAAEAAARAGLSVHEVEEAATAACACAAPRGEPTVTVEVVVEGHSISVRSASNAMKVDDAR